MDTTKPMSAKSKAAIERAFTPIPNARRKIGPTPDRKKPIAPPASALIEKPADLDQWEPRDPFLLAAREMVRRALADRPELGEIARAEGTTISIEVPGVSWVHPIAEAWTHAIWGNEKYPVDGDDYNAFSTFSAPEESVGWCDFRRTGEGKISRSQGNVGVSWALGNGLSIVGFAPVPSQHLPSDLLRIVDVEVVVQPPDGAIVAKVVEAMCGSPPSIVFPDDLCHHLADSDLLLAARKRQTADQYVTRLIKLVRQKAKPSSTMTLDDIGGMHEAVAWGRTLARDLADYGARRIAWADVDPGILLYGPPGTGKTTFAKALAGSCGVPLVTGSLSEWQAAGTGHLGDLLAAMRATFARALKQAPVILFIDEIDGFSNRSAASGQHQDYHVQVVNALLEQLDGVHGRDGVVVVGACNHPERLDPALVRSGRLDKSIRIPLPAAEDLERIFRIHLAEDLAGVDIFSAALKAEGGGTGADVKKWVRGARRTARDARRPMVLDDLLDEIESSERPVTEKMARRFAVHEAGHALYVAIGRPGALVAVTVRRSQGVGGTTAARMDPESAATTPFHVRTALCELLAGRAAEEIVLGDVSGGAGGSPASDLARATLLATCGEATYGLGKTLTWRGDITLGNLDGFLHAHPAIAERVSAALTESYGEALALLRPRAALIEALADLLIEQETISGEVVENLINLGDHAQNAKITGQGPSSDGRKS